MNIDILPTVLELLGLDPPEASDGESQAAAIRGDRAEASHPMVFSETYFRKSAKTTIFDGDYQLIRNHRNRKGKVHQDRLFAADDRLALSELSHARPAIKQELAEKLERWSDRVDELSLSSARPTEVSLDPDTREMLRDLGYVE